MDIVWSSQADAILSGGRYLEDIGVRNWGFNQQQALIALTRLEIARIAVLGGDVYKETAGAIRHTLDNWHVETIAGEPNDVFVARSIARTRAYVSAYRSADAILFVIVPKVA